jgi:hypothetical protein
MPPAIARSRSARPDGRASDRDVRHRQERVTHRRMRPRIRRAPGDRPRHWRSTHECSGCHRSCDTAYWPNGPRRSARAPHRRTRRARPPPPSRATPIGLRERASRHRLGRARDGRAHTRRRRRRASPMPSVHAAWLVVRQRAHTPRARGTRRATCAARRQASTPGVDRGLHGRQASHRHLHSRWQPGPGAGSPRTPQSMDIGRRASCSTLSPTPPRSPATARPHARRTTAWTRHRSPTETHAARAGNPGNVRP